MYLAVEEAHEPRLGVRQDRVRLRDRHGFDFDAIGRALGERRERVRRWRSLSWRNDGQLAPRGPWPCSTHGERPSLRDNPRTIVTKRYVVVC